MRRVSPQKSSMEPQMANQASLPPHNWVTMRFSDPELDAKFSRKYQKLSRLRPVRRNTFLFISVAILLLAERARKQTAYDHPLLWALVAVTLCTLVYLRNTIAAAWHHARKDAALRDDDSDDGHDQLDDGQWHNHPSRASLALVQILTVAVTALLTMALVSADIIVMARVTDANSGDTKRGTRIEAMQRSFWSEVLYLTLLIGIVVPSLNVRVYQFLPVLVLFMVVFYITHFTQRLELVRTEPIEAALLVPATIAYFAFFGYTVNWQTEYMRMRIFWRETQIRRRVRQLRLKSMNMQHMISEVMGEVEDVPSGSFIATDTSVGAGVATIADTSLGAKDTDTGAGDDAGNGNGDTKTPKEDEHKEEALTAAAAAAEAAVKLAIKDTHDADAASNVDSSASPRLPRAAQLSMHLWSSNDTRRQRSSLCAMANLVETGELADTLVTAFSGLRGKGATSEDEVDNDEKESVQKALKLLTHYRQAGTMLMHRRMSTGLKNGLASSAQLNSIQVGLNAIQVSQQWLQRVAGHGIRKHADKSGVQQVFLGGSCNPTTWRKDVAIPTFESKGISYYNPQVDNWTPDLAVLEAEQKEGAQVLLFVIDTATRAIASILEATEYICRGRLVVLSILDVPEGSRFSGADPASANELKDINRGRCYLREVADRHGVAYFSSEQRACDEVVRLLTKPPTNSPPAEMRRFARAKSRSSMTRNSIMRNALSCADLDSMQSIGEFEDLNMNARSKR